MRREGEPAIPHSAEELCDPRRMALLVYYMQQGIAGLALGDPERTRAALAMSSFWTDTARFTALLADTGGARHPAEER